MVVMASVLRRAALIGVGGALLAVVTALGAHPVASRVYTGRVTEPDLINGGTTHPKISFRVSKNGRTMRLKGHAVFSQSCPGGGGSLGVGSRKGDLAPPRVKIRANGRFSGSKSRRYGTSRPVHYGFKGKFKKRGHASGYFWYGDQSQACPFRNGFKLHLKRK
jgi:hypothetical protein